MGFYFDCVALWEVDFVHRAGLCGCVTAGALDISSIVIPK